jgi:peptidoglycan hydrolase-like protein with peptidoglycan-binding domain
MAVVLKAPLWAGNARLQKAANNNPAMRQGDSNKEAVTLLQTALTTAGFPMEKGVDGIFGSQTAGAVVRVEKKFGFAVDGGIAGREALGALDLVLRGWNPPAGAHWGGQLALTIVPLAQRKVRAAINALTDVQNMLNLGGFDMVTIDGVTLAALKTHFKLVPPGGAKLAREDFITKSTIAQLLSNFRGILRTISLPVMIRHTVCTGGGEKDLEGLETAAEAPLGGPMAFGPPYSDFKLDPVDVTNIDVTGPNSLAAMMMHEAVHVIDGQSGSDDTHISEFTLPYETQSAQHARHNPSAYATFAAHIDERADRPRRQRYGLGDGRPL